MSVVFNNNKTLNNDDNNSNNNNNKDKNNNVSKRVQVLTKMVEIVILANDRERGRLSDRVI